MSRCQTLGPNPSRNAAQENWEPKSANLLAIADELDLSELQSFAFIDDNPIEVEEVQRGCPGVSTSLLPQPPEEQARYVAHFWPLDTFRVTEEDTKKTESYKTEATRRSQVAATSSFKEFIEALQLQALSLRPSPALQPWPQPQLLASPEAAHSAAPHRVCPDHLLGPAGADDSDDGGAAATRAADDAQDQPV